MCKKQKSAMAGLLQMVVSAVMTVLLVASCMSDSSDSPGNMASNVCYISNVKFNTMRKKFTVKAQDGVTDSTYYSPYTTSNWVFTIDHKNLTVENRDSLSYKTDLSKCLMTLSYTGGAASYRSAKGWENDQWISYTGSDSIDLNYPLNIRIVATDNTERIYTLKVNVHTVPSDSLKWNPVAVNPMLNGDYPMKAIAWDDKMAAMVNNGSAVLWLAHEKSSQGEWTQQVTDLPVNTEVPTLVFCKDNRQLYVSTKDGALYSSSDGVAWNRECQRDGLRLVAVSEEKLYIMSDSILYGSHCENLNWEKEHIDEDSTLLPGEGIASVLYTDKYYVTRLLMVGNRNVATDTTAVVWGKAWDTFESESAKVWMHYNRTWDNNRQLPMLEHLNLVHYDNKVMAIAGNSHDGKVKAMDFIRVSEDNGLTWWKLQTILLPSDMLGARGYITVAVDADKFLWIIAGGKAYRGRINKLGFVREDI